MNVVEVSSSLDIVESKKAQRSVCVGVSVFLHQPTGRLWAEEDTNDERDGWDHGRSELETPGDFSGSGNDQVGSETKDNTKGSPHLPAHYQSAANPCRRVLGGKYGDGGGLEAHADTKEQTSGEEVFPALSESTADRSQEAEDSRDEDDATTTEVVVQRVGHPDTQEGRSNVRRRVDEANEPLITNLFLLGSLGIASVSNAKIHGKAQVGSVGTGISISDMYLIAPLCFGNSPSLIPTLHCSSDGANDDGEVHLRRVAPSMSLLVPEGLKLVVMESLDSLEVDLVLRNKSASLHEVDLVLETFFLTKELDIDHQLIVRDIGKGVRDPVYS